MKNLIFFSLIILSYHISAQTDSVERVLLHQKALSGKLTPEEFAQLGNDWREMVTKNPYPDIPLNSHGNVEYSFLGSFENISQSEIFHRTLEWLAINHNLIPDGMYTNEKEGKIVTTNSFSIYMNVTCTYTMILSIKNNKILAEFTRIGYQVYRPGHYSGEIWYEAKTDNYELKQIFPVILRKKSDWEYYLKFLKKVDTHFNSFINNLSEFITNYEVYYSF